MSETPEIKTGLEHDPALEAQIREEVARLKANVEGLEQDLQGKNPEEVLAKLGSEGADRFASNTRKIALGAAALIAIPAVAEILSPGSLAQWQDAGQNFLDTNFASIFAGLIAALAVVKSVGVALKIKNLQDGLDGKLAGDAQ